MELKKVTEKDGTNSIYLVFTARERHDKNDFETSLTAELAVERLVEMLVSTTNEVMARRRKAWDEMQQKVAEALELSSEGGTGLTPKNGRETFLEYNWKQEGVKIDQSLIPEKLLSKLLADESTDS